MTAKKSLIIPTLLSLILSISCGKDSAAPEQEFTYAGDYNGFWNTNIENGRNFVDQVSARFAEPDENIFVGTFYYSNNWKPCCGVQHDGEISFKVEGDSLKNLIFKQDFRFSGFQGFSCPGTFTGTGVINDDGNLAFKISGVDCFGSHTGTLLLRKPE